MRARVWLVAVILLGVPGAALAQQGGAAPGAMEAVRMGFTEVSDWIVKAGEVVPEAQFGYRPHASVRTLGELIGHIADGNNYYCARAAGREQEWSDAVATSGAGKSDLLARLKRSIAACTAAASATNEQRVALLIANYGHASLHYGNLVTYLRMLGITPPSSS